MDNAIIGFNLAIWIHNALALANALGG